MSMAKRQQDMKVKVGDRTIWMRKVEAMAEQITVKVEGELVVLVAEGEAGTCEVRLKLDEVERFEEALDKARKRVQRATEARRSREAMKVSGVDDEDFEEAE
jgi:hypothetical protein